MLLLQILLLSFLSSATTKEKLISWESGIRQTHLIELYSSEGCSSCPPADAWLAKLKTKKGLWADYVPIEFHVDYWNYLGWIDKFSHESFTGRQREYASEWKKRTVYTPGFVLNGREWKLGTQKVLKKYSKKVGKLKVQEIKKRKLLIEFKPFLEKPTPYRINIALLGNGLKTKVRAGENSGRELIHEFVVLAMNEAKLEKKKNGKFAVVAEIPENKNIKPKSYSLAIWVSGKKSLKPLQALGGNY